LCRRSWCFESTLGSFIDAAGVGVRRLMDQHAICDVGGVGEPPDVGDLVAFGVSHPCTIIDRRWVIPLADDDDKVVDAVTTLF
jgi:D-serine deaminase-like pyridoxal phosphate-dependent protein